MPLRLLIGWMVLASGLLACEKKEPVAPKPAAPAAKALEPIPLFNGKDLTGWKATFANRGSFWQVGTAKVNPEKNVYLLAEPGGDQFVNTNIKGADIHTERAFRDFTLELEFMLPQEGNSGIFLLGQYELQVEHDPTADPSNPSDMNVGSVPRMLAPKALVPITPGQWHTYEIDFRAPRFEGEKKTENARLLRVAIDGVVVHENAEIPGPTIGALVADAEFPEGPILLQGNHSPVAYRNILITPKP